MTVLGGVVQTLICSVHIKMQPGSVGVRGRMVLRTSWLDREPVVGSSHVISKQSRGGFIPAYLMVPLFALCFFSCFTIYSLVGTYSVELRATRENLRRLSLGLRRLPFTPSSTPSNFVSEWATGVETVLLRTYIDGIDPGVGTYAGVAVPRVPGARVYVAIIAPMYDGATHVDTMVQVLTLIANSSPHTDVRIYIGLNNQEYVQGCYTVFHNASAPLDTHVEFVVLGIKPRTTLSRRTHVLAEHALADMQDNRGFILLVHHSCTLSSRLDIRNLSPDGHGFLLVRPPIFSHALHEQINSHDMGFTSDPLFTYAPRDKGHRPGTVRRAHTSMLHCSGGLMHPIHNHW